MRRKRRFYQVQMYSIPAFPHETRSSLSLPRDPYDVPESHWLDPDAVGNEEAVSYLRGLGVIFYRDEYNTTGIMIHPDDGGPTLPERRLFAAHRHALVISSLTGGPTVWPLLRNYEQRQIYTRYVKRKGDDKAWLHFNKEVTIVQMTDVRVHLA